jgi:hypothetical protein
MPGSKPAPIKFVLTAKQKATLKKKGVYHNKKAVIIRAKFKGGILHITHHRAGRGGKFVSSNSCFV